MSIDTIAANVRALCEAAWICIININYSNSSAHISIFIADKGERTFSVMKLLKSIPDFAAFSFMNTFFSGLTELLLHPYFSNKNVLKKNRLFLTSYNTD